MATHLTKKEDIKRDWVLVDAKDKVVGRLATGVARILMGKHKPSFTRHVDDGDYVVIVNADKVKFTGNKWKDKRYYKHTGFVGGLHFRTAEQMLKEKPEEILAEAIWGMMNKSHLGERQFLKLKVYAGEDHPHKAQSPKKLEL